MNKENIKEKIRKLLKLGESPNRYESENAIKKAQKLILEYNISTVDLEKSPYIEKCVFSKEGYRFSLRIEGSIIRTISDFLDVNGYFKTIPIDINYKGNKFVKYFEYKIFFYGQEHNIEFAEYLFNFINSSMKQLYSLHKKCIRKLDFQRGFLYSIKKNMEDVKHKVSEEWGLVIIKDPELVKKARVIKTNRTNPTIKDTYSLNLGVELGKKINLNRPIENSKDKVLKLN